MSELTVRFWGTRGSIPTPGRHTEKYGGNTTCVELRHDSTVVVLDAGSGIRQMGAAWMEEFAAEARSPIQAHLLFTHLHWDHIQGFPFFTPAYRKGNRFTVYGEQRPDGGIRELLGGQMRGSYFPVPLAAMQAELSFHDTAPEFAPRRTSRRRCGSSASVSRRSRSVRTRCRRSPATGASQRRAWGSS
jgi:ribonuclease Z